MAAVGFDVEQIVDDVGGRGAEAEGEKGEDGTERGAERLRAAPGMGEQQGQEDEDVFRPLVEADGLQPGAEGWAAVAKDVVRGNVGGAQAGHESAVGIGEHGLPANGEDGQVGPGVADVGELFAEAGLEGGEFVASGEVVRAVRGEDVGEDAEMGGDAVGEGAVGGGGEVKGAALRVLVEEELEQGFVVGQVVDIERDALSDALLEKCFALGDPAGDGEERTWMLAGEHKDAVDQGVGLDEGAVEVDAKRKCADGLGRVDGGSPRHRVS